MPLAPVDGVKLFGVEVGSGLPCLVMHGGLGADDTQFREAHDPLGDALRLVYSAVRRGLSSSRGGVRRPASMSPPRR